MKRILFAFTLVLLTASLASAQQSAAPQNTAATKEAVFAVVGEPVHDFGTIKEADGPVTHTFKVKNEGDAPLIITRVTTTCGCTVPEYTKEPIASGQTGDIKVTYTPSGSIPFNRPITVYSNGKAGSSVLTIKGVVEGT